MDVSSDLHPPENYKPWQQQYVLHQLHLGSKLMHYTLQVWSQTRSPMQSMICLLRLAPTMLNIHKGIGYKFGVARCCTLTSAAEFVSLAASCSTVLPKVFSRHLQVYPNVSEPISLSRSPCELQKSWITPVHNYSYWSHSASPFPATGQFH